jgi:hypothetical protein
MNIDEHLLTKLDLTDNYPCQFQARQVIVTSLTFFLLQIIPVPTDDVEVCLLTNLI